MTILGHVFKPMTKQDWYAFAGADEGSMICYPIDTVTLIYSPKTGIVTEITPDPDGERVEFEWSPSARR